MKKLKFKRYGAVSLAQIGQGLGFLAGVIHRIVYGAEASIVRS